MDPKEAADICSNFKLLFPIVIILIALILPINQQLLKKIERPFNKLAQKKQLTILLLGLTSFISSALVSYFYYWPVPYVADEFSYLLAADTFAQFRLTNPSPPMWVHFETFYQLLHPTYASQYPIAQGLILAVGQLLTGYPIVGAWLSVAILCSATCWMLQAWLPPRWALLGGILMILKLSMFSYWSQSYWGGAMAATGGALLFGALCRVIKKPQISSVLCFGFALAILANSRPYEGLLASLPAVSYLAIWGLRKNTLPSKMLVKIVILPLTLVLLSTGLAMCYYNWRVTGNAFLMPYQSYQNKYSNVSNFIWIKPKTTPIKYNHEEIRLLHEKGMLPLYEKNIGLSNYLSTSSRKLKILFDFFLDIPLALILIVLPLIIRKRWVTFAFLSCLFVLIGLLQVIWSYPHYAAPATCLIFFLVLQCARKIYSWRWQGKAVGKIIIWSLPLYFVILILLTLLLKVDPFNYVNPFPPHNQIFNWAVKREAIISTLTAQEGQHLVIVKYGENHLIDGEIVYNKANIEKEKVIWARSMGQEKDCDLTKYFHNHKVWIFTLDSQQDRLQPFAPCD